MGGSSASRSRGTGADRTGRVGHRGRPWVAQGFTSLDDRGSHPCGILRGTPFSVFAKLGPSAGTREEFTAELAGLRLMRQAGHERFGLDGPRGFFGPLPQDNRPVPGSRWPEFFRERRLLPLLRIAADSGYLPPALAAGVEEVAADYQEILPVNPGFAGRRELWRLPAYLAVIAVAGGTSFGRTYLDRLATAIRLYR